MSRAADTPPRAVSGFIVAATSCAVVLFGASRLSAAQVYVLMPLTRVQGQLAQWYAGSPTLPLAVTLECSAADVMAVCLAFTLAYPVRWHQRLSGAAFGLCWILALNTARIAVLGRAARSTLFVPLHLYVWPSLLIALTLGYIVLWLSVAERWWTRPVQPRSPWTRFLLAAAVAVAAFAALLPVLYGFGLLLGPARWIAGTVASILSAAGYTVSAGDNILYTGAGPFMVTPECITTPLMPVYLAAVASLAPSRRSRIVGFVAFVPVFAVLMLVRLLTLALPPLVADTPLLVTHGFFQLLLGVFAVVAACLLRRRVEDDPARRAIRATSIVIAGFVFASLGARPYTSLVEGGAAALGYLVPHTLTSLRQAGDVQGALLVLPIFQVTLFGALCLTGCGIAGWRRPAAGVLTLYLGQLALLVFLGEIGARWAVEVPVTLLRGWAVAAPIALAWAMRPAVERTGGGWAWTWTRTAAHER